MTIDSRTLYATPLGLKAPWEITDVELQQPPGEVHIRVALPAGTLWVSLDSVSSQSAPYARVSENGGRTWVDATVTGSQIKFGWLTRAGTAPNMLYATAPAFGQNLLGPGASRIWISVDHGLTWQVNTQAVVSPGSVLTGGGCRTLIAAPNHPGLLFASLTGVCDGNGNNCCGNCSGKVYRSTDVGLTWTGIGNDLPLQPFAPYQNGVSPILGPLLMTGSPG